MANPFVVAVAVEALKHSRYSDITYIVPGEADCYCALAASKARSVILTEDSDLFLFDIGHSSVVLLSSIYAAEGPDAAPLLKGSEFSPRRIAERLGLGGLCPLAYQLQKCPGVSVAQAIQACASEPGGGPFAQFVATYAIKLDDVRLPPPAKSLSRAPLLDPRISELVVVAMATPLPPERAISPHARVYLPVLLENHDRRNAFQVGRQIRQVAYSLLGLHSPRPLHCVWEFNRLQIGQRNGSAVEVLNESLLHQQTSQVLGRLDSVRELAGDGPQFWLHFALWQEVHVALSTGTESLAAALLRRNRLATPNHVRREARIHWDMVHFRALSHACLYSFRILKQILAQLRMGTVAKETEGPDASGHGRAVRSLWHHVHALPDLHEYPEMSDISSFLISARGTPATEALEAALLGGFGSQTRVQTGPSTRAGADRAAVAPPVAKSIHRNPFETLAEYSG
jgi:hypothetical protein